MAESEETAAALVQKGIAPVKKEFIKPPQARVLITESVDKARTKSKTEHKRARNKKKKEAVQERRFGDNICRPFLKGNCQFGEKCKFSHDVKKYVKEKDPDIHGVCPFFVAKDKCPYDVTCRWLYTHNPHSDSNQGGNASSIDVKKEIKCEENIKSENTEDALKIPKGGKSGECVTLPVQNEMFDALNVLDKGLQHKLRKKKYDFNRADKIVKEIADEVAKRQKEIMKKRESGGGCELSASPKKQKVEHKVLEGGKEEDKEVKDKVLEGVKEEEVKDKVLEGVKEEEVKDKVLEGVEDVAKEHGKEKADVMEMDQKNVDEIEGKGGEKEADALIVDMEAKTEQVKTEQAHTNDQNNQHVKEDGMIVDAPDDVYVEVPLKLEEKPRIDFKNKLYLAPLTTIGNLPYRRVCLGLGVDVTCGEMALATNLLQGQPSEWALLKRHPSEKFFGVQICGGYSNTMTRCAQLVDENIDVDFVDINMGCPIDLICEKCAGASLLKRVARMEQVIRGMSSVLSCPLTIKVRKGYDDKYDVAHKFIPNVGKWGASAVTLHGRSRQQRYTKLADWEYIYRCSEVAGGCQMIGNGDIFSYTDWERCVAPDNIDTCMIARGALIKPWIFTEIKERRHWDISASERLDILKDFCSFGLEHWGSDTRGVETTRVFLLEWMSFLYRYIPVGLLEVIPQHIQWRPPYYYGRNDLETLLASDSVQDWVKISEMMLGPAPPTLGFIPKHRSNSYVVDHTGIPLNKQDHGQENG